MDPVSLASTVAAVLLVAVLAAVAALVVGHRRLDRRLAEARAEVRTLRSRLDDLTRDRDQPVAARTPAASEPLAPAAAPVRSASDYLITRLPAERPEPESAPGEQVAPLTGREFASVALGESLLRLATLAHGVRRAASAENRNRIGFEMRREVKRSRRQRRRDTRDLLRAGRGSDRAALAEDAA